MKKLAASKVGCLEKSNIAFERRIEPHLREFYAAHRAGKKPAIEEYLARENKDPGHVYLSSLIQEDFRGRLARGEQPWITDYFKLNQLFEARATVCRCLNDLLFNENDGSAQQLGIADFGKYRATMLAGFGAFGMVLKARQKGQSEDVAVKLAHPNVDQALTLLKNEHHTLDNLRNRVSGISNLIDSGWCDRLGSEFLILNWVEGQTLDAWGRHPHKRIDVLEVSSQIARIVRDIHKNCCHGDLSPSNILVAGGDGGPSVTLVDFGNSISGFVGSRPFPITARYTAPEVLLDGSARPSVASDLWSLGVVLFELLTGEYPFGKLSLAKTPQELGHHFRQGPVSLQPPDEPARLWGLLFSCLSVDPNKRLQSDAGSILNAIPVLRESLTSPTSVGVAQKSVNSALSVAKTELMGQERPGGGKFTAGEDIERNEPAKLPPPRGKVLRGRNFVICASAVFATFACVTIWLDVAGKKVTTSTAVGIVPTPAPATDELPPASSDSRELILDQQVTVGKGAELYWANNGDERNHYGWAQEDLIGIVRGKDRKHNQYLVELGAPVNGKRWVPMDDCVVGK